MFGINDLRGVKKAGRYLTGVFSRQLENALLAGGSCRKGIVAVFVFAAALLEPVVLHSSPNLSAAGLGGDSRRISDAFAGYVRATDARNNSELRRGTDLLWVDSLPEATQKKAYSDLRRGEIQLEQRTTRESGRDIQCPQCMIHHW